LEEEVNTESPKNQSVSLGGGVSVAGKKYWKMCNQLLSDAWVWSWFQNYKIIAHSGINKHTKISIQSTSVMERAEYL
jgi:hypothetical protein